MIFLILALTCIILGFLAPSSKKSLSAFFVFLLITPSPFFAEKIFSYSSISYLDFFFAGLCLSFITKKIKIKPKNRLTLTLTFSLLLIAIPNIYEINSSLAKDIRVFLFLIIIVICIENLNRHAPNIKIPSIRNILIANAAIDSFIFFYLYLYGIPTWASTDLFYVAEGIFEARYIDFGTIACLLILIKFSADKTQSPISVLACLVSILVSGNRTLILISLIIFIYWIYRTTQKNKGMLLIGLVLSSAALPIINFIVTSRAHTLNSVHSVLDSLYARYHPAIATMQWDNLKFIIFGNGLGLDFFIPWFTFRETEPYAAAVDGLFPTLFAKLGVMSFFILACFFMYLYNNTNDKRSFFLLLFAFSIISVTLSPFYQNTYIIYLLAPIILNSSIGQPAAHNRFSKQ